MRYEKDLRTPNIKTLENLSKALNVPVGYLMGIDDLGADFFFGEKESFVSVGEENAPTDDEMLKINCAAVSSYMEKMNRAGQAVAVQTVKTLADMPEYQKKDEPSKE